MLPIHGGMVNLKVTAVDDNSNGGPNGDGEAIGNGVGIANKFHLKELAQPHHIAR